MKLKFLILLMATGFISLSLFAYDVQQVLFQIAEKEKEMNGISFNFVQKTHFVQMEQDSLVKGQAIFERPHKMRIAKKEPREQTTISNGKKLWVYTPSYQQVWVGEWKDWVKESAMPKGLMPLQDYVNTLKENFNLSLVSSKDKTSSIILHATPKNNQLDYQMDLAISSQTWLPFETTVITDSAKVVTTLSEVKVNPKTEEDTFHFRPPSGTEVISLK